MRSAWMIPCTIALSAIAASRGRGLVVGLVARRAGQVGLPDVDVLRVRPWGLHAVEYVAGIELLAVDDAVHRHRHAHVCAEAAERAWQRAGDVAEAADLRERRH